MQSGGNIKHHGGVRTGVGAGSVYAGKIEIVLSLLTLEHVSIRTTPPGGFTCAIIQWACRLCRSDVVDDR
jgi:hypothetical protein